MQTQPNQSFAPGASLEALQHRAALLQKLRHFFEERDFVEVETPLVADEVIPELHIEPVRTTSGAVLQASPELHMKRLLASGAIAIYEVTRSFRQDERGQLHNAEFTIVEWYRAGDDMQAGIDLLDVLAQTLLGTPSAMRTSYAAAFERTLQICPHISTLDDMAAAAKEANVQLPVGMKQQERDEWLNLLLATIEPQLGIDRPEIIYHFPATQASLARVVTTDAGFDVAERFELYYRGIELANGFHELADATEQRRRFEAVNLARIADGRPALPLPETLLAAMEHGLPDCTGCALGFDRMVMLATGATSIDQVRAFTRK